MNLQNKKLAKFVHLILLGLTIILTTKIFQFRIFEVDGRYKNKMCFNSSIIKSNGVKYWPKEKLTYVGGGEEEGEEVKQLK